MEEVICKIHKIGFVNHLEFDEPLSGFKDGDKLTYHETSVINIITKDI